MWLVLSTTTMLSILNFKRRYQVVDFSALVTALNLAAFSAVIQSVLPIVGVAVLVGFLFYVVRWGIGLFRGI